MGISLDQSLDIESGYASGASSSPNIPAINFTKTHLKYLNSQLSKLEPIDILRWAKLTLPNLYQTTAFGLTGLVTLDLLSKLSTEDPSSPQVDLIFLDTLHHFQQTLTLVEKVKARYPNTNIHIYKPDGLNTALQFEEKYGPRLWETNPDLYDWVAKVEPAQRAYTDLSVGAMLTGRRRSQGAKRSDLGVIDIDEAGLVKINPLFSWSFTQVQDYIKANDVPYNELLDLGYKSVGDWHSTVPVAQGEDERAGRWKGTAKTECGIHNKRSKYAQFLMEQEMKAKQEELSAALFSAPVVMEKSPLISAAGVIGRITEGVCPLCFTRPYVISGGLPRYLWHAYILIIVASLGLFIVLSRPLLCS